MMMVYSYMWRKLKRCNRSGAVAWQRASAHIWPKWCVIEQMQPDQIFAIICTSTIYTTLNFQLSCSSIFHFRFIIFLFLMAHETEIHAFFEEEKKSDKNLSFVPENYYPLRQWHMPRNFIYIVSNLSQFIFDFVWMFELNVRVWFSDFSCSIEIPQRPNQIDIVLVCHLFVNVYHCFVWVFRKSWKASHLLWKCMQFIAFCIRTDRVLF